jgi:hypothetical protein
VEINLTDSCQRVTISSRLHPLLDSSGEDQLKSVQNAAMGCERQEMQEVVKCYNTVQKRGALPARPA